MNFLQKLVAVWQNVNIVQKALLFVISMTLIAVGGFLAYWAGKPDMRLLYQALEPEEASKITDKINERGIPYDLKDAGTTIYVPKEHVYQLRLDMAKEGLPEGGQKGYRIFDDAKIGVSPKVQDINLKRAMQEELAKSIQMLDGIVHARIHIVSPERSIFSSEEQQVTASVALRIKPGYQLSSTTIAAITHLVAGGVDGLKPENVTVVDSQGRLLSRSSDQMLDNGAGTVADYRERVEYNLAKKAEDMLTAVLGPGRASVKVSATIDMTSSNLVTEKYEPKGVPTKEEIESTTETKPSSSTGEGEEAAESGKKAGETIVTEYVVGKTVEQQVVMPGEIKSLKVAAFVDLSPPVTDPNNPEAASEPIMQIADVEAIIKNALGLKDTDSLKVVEAKFVRPIEPVIEEEPSSNWTKYLAIAKHSSMGIMAICTLLALKIFSGARKKAKAEAAASSAELQAAELTGFLPASTTTNEPLVLRRQIATALQNNPDQVKKLFSSWVEEKE